MRVVVDFDLCESNGACEAVLPEVFRVGPDGALDVLAAHPDPRLWPDVETAARACPKFAITIEETP
jgi:ferredoxin